ncbi:MAG: OsmC family protein [Chloroflexota bacterium]
MVEHRSVSATLLEANGMAFTAETASGHRLTLDASAEHGGQGHGPSPMELLLVSLAGCTGMDVISLLRKMRQDVTGYEVRVSGLPASEHPRIYTDVDVEHIVTGRALNRVKVERAVELSATRYCPVSATLSGVGEVRHRATLKTLT